MLTAQADVVQKVQLQPRAHEVIVGDRVDGPRVQRQEPAAPQLQRHKNTYVALGEMRLTEQLHPLYILIALGCA